MITLSDWQGFRKFFFKQVISAGVLVFSIMRLNETKLLSILVPSSNPIVDFLVTSIAVSCLAFVVSVSSLSLIFHPKVKWALLTYDVLSIVVFVAQLTIGMHLLFHANRVYSRTPVDLSRTFALYSFDSDITSHWDRMQVSLGCCGIKNFSDFLSTSKSEERSSIPKSCCESSNTTENDLLEVSNKFCGQEQKVKIRGCKTEIESHLFEASSQIGAYLVYSFVVWWISIIISAGLTISLYRYQGIPQAPEVSLNTTTTVPFTHLQPSFSMSSSSSRTEIRVWLTSKQDRVVIHTCVQNCDSHSIT